MKHFHLLNSGKNTGLIRIHIILMCLSFAACQESVEETASAPAPEGMVTIKGNGADIPDLYMDATEVTTADYKDFVEATNYKTEAEDFGWSGVFSKDSLGWLPVDDATWRFPLGPDSAAAQPEHPVTQLSMRDVRAYAEWAGKRLPTEAEWIWAASQGGQFPEFPWGKEMVPDPENYPGNWWQGPFPYEDAVLDGFPGIAPVKSFPPADNGLYDISGNVWEWTTSKKSATGEFVIKGGSFLCSTSYCTGFNFQQRQFTPADSGLNHLGFRCVKDAK
ncbi:SUMF1/EgtB/PvdO family nonheme iron enzyme [Neolewinella persica]|uniref:SUMF1/EgtB/PvdO family nonheme iron enzyme n=1 Tax=Neolewinella persica TaxID=70998 RepID=UPI00037C110B|nr:SUMF1/EgtB/PvdO family nonheme iron enzyme [Neolewinella persica]